MLLVVGARGGRGQVAPLQTIISKGDLETITAQIRGRFAGNKTITL